jgi:hypothetical protein
LPHGGYGVEDEQLCEGIFKADVCAFKADVCAVIALAPFDLDTLAAYGRSASRSRLLDLRRA